MPIQQLIPHLTLPAVAILVLILLAVNGRLAPGAFDQTPPRAPGITLIDLLIGLWILLAASFLLGPILQLLGIPFSQREGGVKPTIRQLAVTRLLGQVVTQLPIVVFLLWRSSRVPDGARELGLVPRRPGREMAAGSLAFLAAMPMVFGSSAFFVLLARLLDLSVPDVAHDMLRELLTARDAVAITLMAASAVIVAPVLEEIIFRGLVQSALLSALGPSRRWGVVLLSALLFAAIHGGVVTWHVLPGLFILGMVLGWLYERHGSLLPGIVLHILFNLANIGLGMLQEI